MKSNGDLERDRLMTILMIVTQVLIITLVICLFNFIGMSLMFSALSGTLVWSLVLFKTPIFSWFFINVKANWAVILGNQATYDRIPKGLSVSPQQTGTVDPRTQMYKLSSLREIGPGLRGKFPWEIPFESVDLRSEIVIGNEKEPLKCYTKDNIERVVIWQAVLTPLRGHLANLVRRGENATKAYFTGTFENKIREWVRSKMDSEIDQDSADLKTAFAETFGGEDTIHKIEEDYGMFTNTPQILTINRSASYQKAAEAVMVAEQMQKVVTKLSVSLKGADHNMILAAATAIVGNDINGLLLIPGIQGNPQTLNAVMAAAANLGIKAGNQKGKKP